MITALRVGAAGDGAAAAGKYTSNLPLLVSHRSSLTDWVTAPGVGAAGDGAAAAGKYTSNPSR